MEKDSLTKSFVFYREWYETVKSLPNDDKLRLADKVLMAIVSYALDEGSGKTGNPIADAFLKPILAAIDTNKRKYRDKCDKMRDNANERWEKQRNAIGCNCNQKDYETDTDTDTFTESLTLTDSESDNGVLSPTKIEFLNDTFQDRALIESEFSNNGVTDGEEIQKFIDYYSARGWKINGEPIKDVAALVRSWLRKAPHFSRIECNSKRSQDFVEDAMRKGIQEAINCIDEAKKARKESAETHDPRDLEIVSRLKNGERIASTELQTIYGYMFHQRMVDICRKYQLDVTFDQADAHGVTHYHLKHGADN